ncbi:acyl carrier protein [Brenneria rubrifaciens]|uniref:Acyl carrier protein n=1 Tax=Brenneria rubrifaciens TaxID=55213 RepID=A0A4P8QKS6_9GAMM|nr:acyl carrier protein [Brenneria rubrifaciens]QCR07672.1 acyl carrier protein [Brenneria rubrifaciens]
MENSLEVVRPQISLVLDMDQKDITLETNLKENEKWDSFAILAAVALVTKHTGKQMTVDEMKKITNVGDLVAFLKA